MRTASVSNKKVHISLNGKAKKNKDHSWGLIIWRAEDQ